MTASSILPATYSCLGHEIGHATGAKHRLDRDLTGRFGSAKYAMDEIIVELASSFITADLGIAHRPRAEHAAYIASWLKVLGSDPRAIFTAAGKAEAAADWMHAQQIQRKLGSSVRVASALCTGTLGETG